MNPPNPPTRQAAQQRVDDIHTFRLELMRLEDEGVIALPEPQRQAVNTHHDALLARLAQGFDLDHDHRAKQLSLGMRIVSLLGALALGASVFFLFYRFWGYLTTTVQVATLVSAALGSFLLTTWINRRDPTGYFTRLSAMVAFTCFVLNIVMLGQIFNINPSDKALLPWAAFAFVLAYGFEARLLQAAGILCIAAYIAARCGAWGGLYWLDFGRRPENFFAAAVAIFMLPQVVDQSRFSGFAATYRVFGALLLFLPVLVLAHWGESSYWAANLGANSDLVEGVYQVVGFVGTAALAWWAVKRQWPEVMNTGVTLFIIFFYSKLFDWWWETMPKYLFFLVLGLTAILLLMVFKRLRQVQA